ATFLGVIFSSTSILSSWQDSSITSFLQQWAAAFSIWPLKMLGVLAIPAVPCLVYAYLVKLEATINPSSETEGMGFFSKFPLHCATLTTVPILLTSSLASAILLKVFAFSAVSTTLFIAAQISLSVMAFGILFQTYSGGQPSVMTLLKGALPAAVMFEVSKHGF